MKENSTYSKSIETIKKKDFISFFSGYRNPDKMFSKRELEKFPFPGKAQSLAGRYLIKKAICEFICDQDKMHEIEILNDSFGKPEILMGVDLSSEIKKNGIKKICCSISHSKNYITGMTLFCF
jgi:phosphopantetheinyl transferase (holo-ACP synthase)